MGWDGIVLVPALMDSMRFGDFFVARFPYCSVDGWMDGWMVAHTLLTLLTDDYNAINGLFLAIRLKTCILQYLVAIGC